MRALYTLLWRMEHRLLYGAFDIHLGRTSRTVKFESASLMTQQSSPINLTAVGLAHIISIICCVKGRMIESFE